MGIDETNANMRTISEVKQLKTLNSASSPTSPYSSRPTTGAIQRNCSSFAARPVTIRVVAGAEGIVLMHVRSVVDSDLLVMVGREDTDLNWDQDQDVAEDVAVMTMDVIA